MGSSKRHCNDKRQISRRSKSRSPVRGHSGQDRHRDENDRQHGRKERERKKTRNEKNVKNEEIEKRAKNVGIKPETVTNAIKHEEIEAKIKTGLETDAKLIKSGYTLYSLRSSYDALEAENELEVETKSELVSVDIGSVKFGKPNKTRSKMRKPRRISVEEESMETDETRHSDPTPPLKFDDSESQLTAKLRRLRQKQTGNSDKNFVSCLNSLPVPKSPVLTENCLMFTASTEFCRGLGEIPTFGMSGNRDTNSNELMDDFDDEASPPPPEIIHDDETDPQGGWNEVDINEKPMEPEVDVSEYKNWFVLDEEPDASNGVGATLKLLRMKGLMDKEDEPKQTGRSSSESTGNYRIDDKYGADDDNQSRRRERYYGGSSEPFPEKVDYKPDVKLVYTDDHGEVLCAKEAFRHMSHKFHGIESGKKKTEKRLKKLQQADLARQMSSGDTPLNTVKLMKEKHRKTQMPYVVINSGSGKKMGSFNVISK